jgi:hypothetical protein
MIHGDAVRPENFNYAFLVCLAKGSGQMDLEGTVFHEASETRPLSIVDAANRIIASAFRIALERNVADWVSDMQRGFLHGRHMLRNILDIDLAAQKISVKTRAGAILLFDFRAAFPSMDHAFMWETLAAIGLPDNYIKALQMFYDNNKHFMKVGGVILPSVIVESGVRQGCPLSPLLFAICADILLKELQKLISGDEIVRAFADDTAMVVSNYTISLPILASRFAEFERISALALNVSKTVFIPLWTAEVSSNLKNLVREACPEWRDIRLDSKGKYLGFVIGPGAGSLSWELPFRKYVERAEAWASLHLGMNFNIMVYDSFISTVLSYVMQLEEEPAELHRYFEQVLRRLAPGPGNRCSAADLVNLKQSFSFPRAFRDPRWTGMAAKLRTIEYVAPDLKERERELEEAQLSHFRRPCGSWHRRSYFSILGNVKRTAAQRGIDRTSVLKALDVPIVGRRTADHKARVKDNYQRAAETLICQKFADTYYTESRLRCKLHRWKLSGIPAHLESQILRNFKLLSQWCPPRVIAAYFRALWNGWTTDRRMASLRKSQGLPLRGCQLGCGWDEDCLEHYATCKLYWDFLSLRRPAGLGLATHLRCREAFFMVHPSLDERNTCRLALGMYALHRVVSSCGYSGLIGDAKAMLRIFTRVAAEGSRSKELLL